MLKAKPTFSINRVNNNRIPMLEQTADHWLRDHIEKLTANEESCPFVLIIPSTENWRSSKCILPAMFYGHNYCLKEIEGNQSESLHSSH